MTLEKIKRSVQDSSLKAKCEEVQDLIQQLLIAGVSRVLATNLDSNRFDSQNYYCLICEEDHIIFAEKRGSKKITFRLDLSEAKLFLNDSEVNVEKIDVFINHVQRVVADVSNKHARVYNKKD